MSAPLPLLVQVLRHPACMATLEASEWELLLRQAGAAGLTATLCVLAEEQGLFETLPPAARRRLGWARTVWERHVQAVRFEIRQIKRALAGTGLPLLLLKGSAYLAAGLPAAGGRMFSDIDILVPKEGLPDVESQLMLHGWASTHHDAYDQRYYREWMHELPPMQHMRRGSAIDVHHAILPLTAAVRPDPALLRAAARPAGEGCRVLAPCDMVLHSATHLFSEGEYHHGLRGLFDLHRLLGHFGALETGFWTALPARAQQLQLERPLFYALRYCTRLLATQVPAHTVEAAQRGRPPAPLLTLMDALFERALRPPHPSCATALDPAAHAMLYIRGNWLRMPPLMLSRHLFHKAFLSSRAAPAR
ncbi:nucleotidyltransferase domain-containing protein [Massilia sp. SYSU DXS3249]